MSKPALVDAQASSREAVIAQLNRQMEELSVRFPHIVSVRAGPPMLWSQASGQIVWAMTWEVDLEPDSVVNGLPIRVEQLERQVGLLLDTTVRRKTRRRREKKDVTNQAAKG